MRLHPDWNPVPGVPWLESTAMKNITAKQIKQITPEGKVLFHPMANLSKFYRAELDGKGNHIKLPEGYQLIYSDGTMITIVNPADRRGGNGGRGQPRGTIIPPTQHIISPHTIYNIHTCDTPALPCTCVVQDLVDTTSQHNIPPHNAQNKSDN